MGTKTQKLSNIVDSVVEWQPVVVADGSTGLTTVAGRGYFIDTTSGTITVTLPASPKIGDAVAISDIATKFAINNVTISRNGSNINGSASDVTLTSGDTQKKYVYSNLTYGWIDVNSDNELPEFVSATGGTVTTSGDFKIHTFTGDGCFVVSSVGNSTGSTSVDYLIVAGGGGGGGGTSGSGGGSGGGAGGFRTTFPSPNCNAGSFPISAQTYPISVGAGGGGGGNSEPNADNNGSSGSNSVFSTITSAGGGGGMHGPCSSNNGVSGGSGSGASGGNPSPRSGGAGNTPSVSPPQGNPGGDSLPFVPGSPYVYESAGGGGAGGAGGDSQPGPRLGGVGSANAITGSPVTYSRGGNGGRYTNPTTPLSNEPANSGNGGFGKDTGPNGAPGQSGANGGKGIVILRYKFQ